MPQMLKNISKALDDRPLKARRQYIELDRVNIDGKLIKNACRMINATARMGITDQIQRSERWRRHPHRASVGLSLLDALPYAFNVLAEIEGEF